MKKTDKLAVAVCLDEIKAVVRGANNPLIRKTYLMARRWYGYQKEQLNKLGYRGKIDRLPKHKVKKGIIEEAQEMREVQVGRVIEIFSHQRMKT